MTSNIERLIGRLIYPSVLIAISLFAFVCACFIGVFGDKNSNYFFLISALAVSSGVLFTQSVKLHSEMRDRAYNFLQSAMAEDKFFESTRMIRDFYKLNRRNDDMIMSNALAIYKNSDRESVELIRSIFYISNFYEQIYIMISNNEVHGHIIEDFYNGMFCRTYACVKNFYPALRNDLLDDDHTNGAIHLPELFCGVDKLYDVWSIKYYKNFCFNHLDDIGAVDSKLWTGM